MFKLISQYLDYSTESLNNNNLYDKLFSKIKPFTLNIFKGLSLTRYESLYDTFDKGHDRIHMEYVRRTAMYLYSKYGNNDQRELELVYIAATLHDIGLSKTRENHELIGSIMVQQDNYLKKYLTKQDIDIISNAIKEHRYISGNPQSIIDKCIYDADKIHGSSYYLVYRAIMYSIDNNKNISYLQSHVEKAFSHLIEKYGKIYTDSKLFFNDSVDKLKEQYNDVAKWKNKNIYTFLMNFKEPFKSEILKYFYIYHNLYNDKYLNIILKEGKLLPVNKLKLKERIADYEKRSKTGEADDYFEETYNKRYKQVLKEPYKNYGIYFTPLDIFKIDDKLKYRFKLRLIDLIQKGDRLVVQVGADVKKINSVDDVLKIMQKYVDEKIVKEIYNNSKLKYKRLIQIVDFEDSVEIDKSMLEEKKI